MGVLDNNVKGTLESNIDVGEMLLPDNQIAIVASYSNWCYPYIFGGVRLNTTFQGMGTIAYRIDDGVFLNVQQADVDTIGIVDGQEVERKHQAPRIIRFQKNKK